MPQTHPVFEEPLNRSERIWRYMDFTKFLSLLEDRTLFFSRADRLGDPFEGSFPRANSRMRPVWYKEIVDRYEEKNLGVTFQAIGKRMSFLQSHSFLHQWLCQWTLVNCWHINHLESAAMWRLYAATNQAIALQTTYEQLRSCLPDSVLVGMVKYIDYDTEVIPEDNTLWPFVHKRLSFSHEKELRAVIQDLPIENDTVAVGRDNPEAGRLIAVDVETLIDRVYVAPSAPGWFADLVRKTARRYGFSKDVMQSALDAMPMY